MKPTGYVRESGLLTAVVVVGLMGLAPALPNYPERSAHGKFRIRSSLESWDGLLATALGEARRAKTRQATAFTRERSGPFPCKKQRDFRGRAWGLTLAPGGAILLGASLGSPGPGAMDVRGRRPTLTGENSWPKSTAQP